MSAISSLVCSKCIGGNTQNCEQNTPKHAWKIVRCFPLREGVVVGAFALESVDLEFISLVESYHKIKNGVYFPAWRSAQKV